MPPAPMLEGRIGRIKRGTLAAQSPIGKPQRPSGCPLYGHSCANYTAPMKKFNLGLSLLFSLGVLMAACGDDGGSGGACPSGQVSCDGVCINEITATLDGANGIQAAVFQPTCTFSNCHGSEGIAQADLELSSVAVSEQELIDVDSTQVPTKLRVAPGQSADSYLMNKILGTGMADGTLQMPVGGMLCAPRLEAIEQWIDAGAPVN